MRPCLGKVWLPCKQKLTTELSLMQRFQESSLSAHKTEFRIREYWLKVDCPLGLYGYCLWVKGILDFYPIWKGSPFCLIVQELSARFARFSSMDCLMSVCTNSTYDCCRHLCHSWDDLRELNDDYSQGFHDHLWLPIICQGLYLNQYGNGPF